MWEMPTPLNVQSDYVFGVHKESAKLNSLRGISPVVFFVREREGHGYGMVMICTSHMPPCPLEALDEVDLTVF